MANHSSSCMTDMQQLRQELCAALAGLEQAQAARLMALEKAAAGQADAVGELAGRDLVACNSMQHVCQPIWLPFKAGSLAKAPVVPHGMQKTAAGGKQAGMKARTHQCQLGSTAACCHFAVVHLT